MAAVKTGRSSGEKAAVKHIQFRVDDEVALKLERILAEALEQGAEQVSVHTVARMLMLAAMNEPKKKAIALTMLMEAYTLMWRLSMKLKTKFDADIHRLIDEVLIER